jgi:hypothetical protein
MFRTAPAVEPATGTFLPVESSHLESLVPLSVLSLDHPQPAEGWSNFLGRKAITIRPDHIGRDAISSHDAQALLHEQRANELRAMKLRQLQEQLAVEADELRRSQIWKGVSADAMPSGVAPASVMLQLDKDSQPRRTTPLEEALSNTGSLTYHAWPNEDEAS